MLGESRLHPIAVEREGGVREKAVVEDVVPAQGSQGAAPLEPQFLLPVIKESLIIGPAVLILVLDVRFGMGILPISAVVCTLIQR